MQLNTILVIDEYIFFLRDGKMRLVVEISKSEDLSSFKEDGD